MTRDEARAACLATGAPLADCLDKLDAFSLPDGSYCDGTIVRSLDAAGRPLVRCVSRATIKRKLAASITPPRAAVPAPSSVPLALLVALGGALALWILGRD